MPTRLKQLLFKVKKHPILGQKKGLQKELRRFERRLEKYQAKIENMTKQ